MRSCYASLVLVFSVLLMSDRVWAQDGLQGPVDASDTHVVFAPVAGSPTLPTDTVPAGTPLSGPAWWSFQMFNHSGEGNSQPPTSFTNPTMVIHGFNDNASITADLYPQNQYNQTVAFPFVVSAPLLPPFPGLPGAFRQDFNNSSVQYAFTPGYDSSRTVSPLVIPPGGSNQTVTVTIKIVDPRYQPGVGTVSGSIFGVRIVGLGANNVVNPGGGNVSPNGDEVGWSVFNPTLNTDYTFMAVIHVPNGASAVVSKPTVLVTAGNYHTPTSVISTTTTILDPLLGAGGQVTFSVDQPVNWHPRDADETFGVTYTPVLTTSVDTTPPTISGLPAGGCMLWPPNHQLISVATVTASDSESGLASLVVTGSSNEPDNGLGDGDTPNDIVITGAGTGPYSVQLRAERSGKGPGRVYTLTATATDVAGNTVRSSATCVVPHDQRP